MKYVFTIFILMTCLLSMAGPGFSHGVRITAHFTGSEVHTDSYFADGKPISGAEVTAYNMGGKEITKGMTREDGAYNFANPGYNAVKIVLSAPSGHRGETILEREDRLTIDSGPGSEEFPDYLKDALAKELEPMREEIRSLRMQVEKPGIAEVLGGIGWIVGLAGVFLWGVSRKKSG